jgi:hypothetical protein
MIIQNCKNIPNERRNDKERKTKTTEKVDREIINKLIPKIIKSKAATRIQKLEDLA